MASPAPIASCFSLVFALTETCPSSQPSNSASDLQTAARQGLNFGASAKSVQSIFTIRHLRNASWARTVLSSMPLSAPAPFAKLRGNYRFHLQLYGTPGDLLREAAKRVLDAKLKTPAAVQWIVDVDPLDSL